MKPLHVELGLVNRFIFLLGVAFVPSTQSATLLPVMLKEATETPWNPKEYGELLVVPPRGHRQR